MEYDGLDVYNVNGTWAAYNNYVYDPYREYGGNYTYNKDYQYYDLVSVGTGDYSWNYSNIGFYNDASGNSIWYYKLVDNSYVCKYFGAHWDSYCNAYINWTSLNYTNSSNYDYNSYYGYNTYDSYYGYNTYDGYSSYDNYYNPYNSYNGYYGYNSYG
jgi:hypothetical protein